MKLGRLAGKDGMEVSLSPEKHAELMRHIVDSFVPQFAPGGELVYIGDTVGNLGFFDKDLLANLGVVPYNQDKLPDVVIYLRDKAWLMLIDAVTGHGPVDSKRQSELARLFEASGAGLVYISAFPDRDSLSTQGEPIAWETNVWIADAPTHMIHFNGSRFLGPY